MSSELPPSEKPRRGRPPKTARELANTRELLIRSGLEVITTTGYLAAGIEAIIKNIAVPKGSFYHYFKSKNEFGMVVLETYGQFFAHKLDKFLLNTQLSPLQRLAAFVVHAGQGMAKYDFKRGCLVGNLLQETPLLPDDFPAQLQAILHDWQSRVAHCLQQGQLTGEINSTLDASMLAQQFWSGWEGAVMRAKLFRSVAPLDQFWLFFHQCVAIESTR